MAIVLDIAIRSNTTMQLSPQQPQPPRPTSSASSILSTHAKRFYLDSIHVSLAHVSETLRCILHTILFTRAPGPVAPSSTTSDVFQFTYARCGVRDVDQEVEKLIKQVIQNHHHQQSSSTSHSSTSSSSRVVLRLAFFERHVTTALFGLMSNEEKRAFEEWEIIVDIEAHGNHLRQEENDDRRTRTALAVQRCLFSIISRVQNEVAHMPAVMYEYDMQLVNHSYHR